MPSIPTSHVLEGEEKTRYMTQLDDTIKILVRNFPQLQAREVMREVQHLAEQDHWDWSRLPKAHSTRETLAGLAQRVREEYWWFSDYLHAPDARDNRGYFQKINISASSGLPWPFDFIELHRLKKEAEKLLAEMPSYRELQQQWEDLVMHDTMAINEVMPAAGNFQRKALERSFLEHLQEATLLGWETSQFSLPPQAEKVRSLGGEDLWTISFIQYSLASGMFHLYVMDVWQDIREPQITFEQGRVALSSALLSALKFSEQNHAWYMIESVDDRFPSLHPVHVSRLLLGPFETKYLTHSEKKEGREGLLLITQKLLQEDPTMGLFRFSWQYSYAPNHRQRSDDTKELQQQVYREDWRMEGVVCPTRVAGRVAKSVEGTDVQVWQY